MKNWSSTLDLDLCKSWNVKSSGECLIIQLSMSVVVEASIIYRVYSFYRNFPGCSCRTLYSTISDDQCLIFFPDMGDFCT